MSYQGFSAEHTQARLEDLRWMAATGECASGAAKRIGTNVKNLEKWCRRHDADLWRRLMAQEPRDWNCHNGGANQWNAYRQEAS